LIKLKITGAEVIQLDYLEEQTIRNAAEEMKVAGYLDVLVNCGGRYELRLWKLKKREVLLIN